MNALPDYRDDPIAYEVEEAARPDEMLMLEGVRRHSRAFLDQCPDARVMDLCCGTGLSLLGVADHPSVTQAVGIDNCVSYLDYATHRLDHLPHLEFILADAVDPPARLGQFDLIITCSGYHHIDDARKLAFLRRIRERLSDRGKVVLGENIIPPYDDSRESYASSIRFFYREVLATARKADPTLPREVGDLIERVAQYGYDGEYEYKTSLDILLQYLHHSALRVSHIEKVWPGSGALSGTTGGNYVLELEKRTTAVPDLALSLDSKSALLRLWEAVSH